MEYAIRTDDGLNNIVYMKDIIGLGEREIKSYRYICADKNCGIKMIVVYSKNEGKKGNQSHRAHFRVSPKHEEKCKKGARQKSTILDSSQAKGSRPIHESLKQMDYPIEFTEVDYVKRRSHVKYPDKENFIGENEKNNTKNILRGEHESKHKTKLLKVLVESFKKNKDILDKMEIKIKGCPARNYASAFVNLESRKNNELEKMSRHIFYGKYLSHQTHKTGNSILFGLNSISSKKVGIWVADNLEPSHLLKEIEDKLKKAPESKNTPVIYVLGKFINHQNWKYSIELETANLMWIDDDKNS